MSSECDESVITTFLYEHVSSCNITSFHEPFYLPLPRMRSSTQNRYGPDGVQVRVTPNRLWSPWPRLNRPKANTGPGRANPRPILGRTDQRMGMGHSKVTEDRLWARPRHRATIGYEPDKTNQRTDIDQTKHTIQQWSRKNRRTTGYGKVRTDSFQV